MAVILGLDPGSMKSGLACVDAFGEVVARQVCEVARLEEVVADWMAKYQVVAAVVGNGTGSEPAVQVLQRWLVADQILVRDETGTTLQARERYWRMNPPRGLWRLVPTTMRVPPEPYDDWVAVLLAERAWDERQEAG